MPGADVRGAESEGGTFAEWRVVQVVPQDLPRSAASLRCCVGTSQASQVSRLQSCCRLQVGRRAVSGRCLPPSQAPVWLLERFELLETQGQIRG